MANPARNLAATESWPAVKEGWLLHVLGIPRLRAGGHVFGAIAKHWNRHSRDSFPSQEVLAADAACSVKTVQRWIVAGIEAGVLATRVERYAGGFRRRLIYIPVVADAPDPVVHFPDQRPARTRHKVSPPVTTPSVASFGTSESSTFESSQPGPSVDSAPSPASPTDRPTKVFEIKGEEAKLLEVVDHICAHHRLAAVGSARRKLAAVVKREGEQRFDAAAFGLSCCPRFDDRATALLDPAIFADMADEGCRIAAWCDADWRLELEAEARGMPADDSWLSDVPDLVAAAADARRQLPDHFRNSSPGAAE